MSEFDKEEEREKLRKQLAEDEERRKSTQKMSELLLKGATMLNVHCDQCASPLFRDDGEEFCPTCGRTIDEIQSATAPPEPTSEAEDIPADDTTVERPLTTEASPQSAAPTPQTNAGEALEAAISRLADRAATAEDPRQAGELLEAAKTAAETLALVEGRSQSGS